MKPPVILYADFPELIDNTAREQFFSCPQRFFRSTIQKLQQTPPSIHLHAGGAYAAGLEALRKAFYDENLPESEALAIGVETLIKFYGAFDPPEGSTKTCERMVGALVDYVREYPLATDTIKPYRLANGKSAIEFTFAIPIPDTSHPVTGQPLLYGGRFDMLAIREDVLFVEDDKTTSQLGQTWGQQWELNSQFTGYVWAAQEFGLPVAGAIIRGQSILKNSYGHAQSIVYRPQWMIDRWLEQLQHDVRAMIHSWETNRYSFALGGSCSHYGGCEFRRLCQSQNPQSWIDAYYINRHWNPLAKDPEEGTALAAIASEGMAGA